MPDLARAAWLQAMMSRRIVTDSECRALHRAACTAARASYDASNYDEFVHEAGAVIAYTGLEIRRMVDEWTGKLLVAVVNTKGDELAQLATPYTPQELSLINTWIEAIFTAPYDAYSIGTTKALNLSSRIKPTMTKKAAQELLDSLIRHNWLRRSQKGRLSLTTRTLLELQNLLKDQYPDFAIECACCHDLVTRGAVCRNMVEATDEDVQPCDVRVHHACEKQLPGYRANSAKCPGCKASWDPMPIGEERGQGDARQSRSRLSGRNSRGCHNESGSAEEDEEYEDARDADRHSGQNDQESTKLGEEDAAAAAIQAEPSRTAQRARDRLSGVGDTSQSVERSASKRRRISRDRIPSSSDELDDDEA